MWPDNERIGSKEILVLIVGVGVGSGIIMLPATLAGTTGPDAWLSVVLAWVVAIVGALAIVRVVQRHPHQGVVSIAQATWGKFVAKTVGVLYTLYFIVIVAGTLRAATEQIKIALLPKTPTEVLMIGYIAVAVYLVREGLEPISRFMTILFPLFITPVIFLLVALRGAQFDNVLPFLANGPLPVLRGGLPALLALAGFEGLLVWAIAVRQPERLMRPVIIGLAVVASTTLITVLVTTFVFTPAQAANLVIVPKSIVDTINLPRTVIGRFDVIIFSLWVTASLATFIIGLYTLCRFVQDTVGLRSPSPLVLPLIPILYIVALLPENTQVLDNLFHMINWVGLVAAVIFPVFLWLWLALRDRLHR